MTSDKLKDDPIIEALLELRFESKELPEVVIGRLSDMGGWQKLVKTRLPTADIPVPFRNANEQMRFLPSLEISEPNNIRARIGANVLSVHFLPPYPCWPVVSPKLQSVIDGLFVTLPGATITRLGLRYVNAFTAHRHFVKSVNDLNLEATVAGAKLEGPISLAFWSPASTTQHVNTRVISQHFFQGQGPVDATAVVDVDVFTPAGFSESTPDGIKTWVEAAHTIEKAAFRKLLPDDLYQRLREPNHASIH